MNLDTGTYDHERYQYDCDRGDAEAKEARILADVKHWRCCGCGNDCAVNLDRPFLGAISRCCNKLAYNCDEIEEGFTNHDSDANRRMAELRKMEGET